MITDDQADSLVPGQTLYTIQPPIELPGYEDRWHIFECTFALNHRDRTYTEGEGRFPTLATPDRDSLFLTRAEAVAYAVEFTENQKRAIDAKLRALQKSEAGT